jgi:hypothetical protein
MISSIISAFPTRFALTDTFPPFIHRSALLSLDDSGSATRTLAACQEICRLFSSARSHCTDAILDTINTEQERLYALRGCPDPQIHISCAQASTVYLIMLTSLAENLPKDNILGTTLLFTLGTHFGPLNKWHTQFLSVPKTPTWEDWILAESISRTAMLYFIVGLLFDLQFGLPCDREFDYCMKDIHLPAPKALWDAPDKASWLDHYLENHNVVESRMQYGYLVTRNNHALRTSPATSSPAPEMNKIFYEWQGKMDEYGMLVNLCSTLE